MSKSEVKNLFFWRQNCWIPCGLNLKEQLWWRFMPGVVINVRWPCGWAVLDDGDQTYSADPNNHYRPWLEKHVGQQGWDWNWGVGRISGMAAIEHRLTIKIRQKYAEHATIAALRWS